MTLFQDSLLHTEFQANLSYKVRLSYKNYPHRNNWARVFSYSSTKWTKTKTSFFGDIIETESLEDILVKQLACLRFVFL